MPWVRLHTFKVTYLHICVCDFKCMLTHSVPEPLNVGYTDIFFKEKILSSAFNLNLSYLLQCTSHKLTNYATTYRILLRKYLKRLGIL